MKYYHMIVQYPADRDGSTRREYISTTQGAAPPGYICVGVCGFHEKPREVQKPCIGCVYYAACGSTTRTAPCDGRKTKSEAKEEAEYFPE
jgi:hypothetical protein